MESVCVEQEIDCEVRNKYENKIIKKHFINSAKSNKNKRPKKKKSQQIVVNLLLFVITRI